MVYGIPLFDKLQTRTPHNVSYAERSCRSGLYTIISESDIAVGTVHGNWTGTAFVDIGDILTHGDATWATIPSATVAAAVLTTPANTIGANVSGEVVASNMRGTDSAYTGTPDSAATIAAAVWAAAARTLTSTGTLVADVATAVWGATVRTLSAFGFTVTATDVAAIKLVTDKVNPMLEDDGGVDRFTPEPSSRLD